MENEKKRRPRITKSADDSLEERNNDSENDSTFNRDENFERDFSDEPKIRDDSREDSFQRNFNRDQGSYERRPYQDRNSGGGGYDRSSDGGGGYQQRPYQDRNSGGGYDRNSGGGGGYQQRPYQDRSSGGGGYDRNSGGGGGYQQRPYQDRSSGGGGYDRNSGGGGGYQQRPYQDRSSGGGGYDRNSGGSGGYQQRPYQDRSSGGGGYDRNSGGGGGYQQRPYQDRSSGGGGYDRNSGGGGGYQQRPYQDRSSGGGGYDRNSGGGGGYQQRPYQDRSSGGGGYDRNSGGGGYQQRPYQDRSSGGGGYDRNSGGSGGYQQRPQYGNRGGGGGFGNKPFGRKPSFRKQPDFHVELLPKADMPTGEGMPLNKFLAHCGLASRRKAVDFIEQGLVSVNGTVVKEPYYRYKMGDAVICDGKKMEIQERQVYILLNKPKNIITTTDDEHGRPTVLDIVDPHVPERIFPVGRLDRDTTGLILLTNDGEVAQKLTHPSHFVQKQYRVGTDRPVGQYDLEKIAAGIELEDGPVQVSWIRYAEDHPGRDVLEIEISEGRNRIVRRIFEALGYEVKKLDRFYFAGLTKKDLPRGQFRELTQREVIMMKHFTGQPRPPKDGNEQDFDATNDDMDVDDDN